MANRRNGTRAIAPEARLDELVPSQPGQASYRGTVVRLDIQRVLEIGLCSIVIADRYVNHSTFHVSRRIFRIQTERHIESGKRLFDMPQKAFDVADMSVRVCGWVHSRNLLKGIQ